MVTRSSCLLNEKFLLLFLFISACDLAGPLFVADDITKDFKKAAKNVQCIHTSTEFGTKARKCSQDWLMGICGIYQPAAKPWMKEKSHALCNEFYINSFDFDFIAYDKYNCPNADDVNGLPYQYKMGYMEDRKLNVTGVIPCPTTLNFPFNFDIQNDNLIDWKQ